MKNIYLIFIVTCLVKQLKADVYAVTLNQLTGINQHTVHVTLSQGFPKKVIIYEDIVQGIWAEIGFFYSEDASFEFTELKDLCNMDTSTNDGTLAAIAWGVMGIKSCPIAAGTYPVIREFNQTGIIDMFGVVDGTINIVFNIYTSDDVPYFQGDTDIRLVEKEPGSPDDGEEGGS